MNPIVRALMALSAFILMLTSATCRSGKSGDIIRTVTSAEKSLELSLNDSLRIALGQCIGCEDWWKVLFADSAISVSDAGYIPHCRDCDGGTGDALFMVKALRPGEARIGFGYFSDTVIFQIRVK